MKTTTIIPTPTWGTTLQLFEEHKRIKLLIADAQKFRDILDVVGHNYECSNDKEFVRFTLIPKNTMLKTEYEGYEFTLEFAIGNPLRATHKGKHWPKTTQCIIKKNGLTIGVGEVVKHEKDADNPKYAKMYAAKKAFKNAEFAIWKQARIELWKQILTK